jgi:hypothetical protein
MKRTLLALLALVFACGQDDCVEVGVVDEGFHVAFSEELGDVELYPMVMPAAIAADPTLTAEDPAALGDALAWCNEQASQDGIDRITVVEAEEGETPRVTVAVGYVPAPEGLEALYDDAQGVVDAGIAYLDYAEDGEVLGAEVVVAYEIAYDGPTLRDVIAHEVCGHSVWGLADDPGIDVTVELQSFMGTPIDPLGELTEADFVLIEPYLP